MPVKGGCRWFCAALVLYLYLPGLNSQTANQGPAGTGAAAQSGGSFNMRVDVDLVAIEVAALDKNQKAVRNLKKEDFTLYEDGKKQEILSFDEVEGQAATSPGQVPLMDQAGQHRGKTVMILFIDSSIAPRYVRASRESAWKFVREHMQPQDLFAVGTYVSSMQILQDFTSDRDGVLAAIEKSLNSYGTGGMYFDDLLRSLEQINLAIARLKGQKSILMYASIGLGGSPATGSPYANALNSARKSNVVFYTVDPNVDFAGSNPAPGVMPSVGFSSRSSGLVPVTLMSLARESGGFSIYNTTNFSEELDKLDDQLSNYYILGFQSNNPKHDGAFRKIEA